MKTDNCEQACNMLNTPPQGCCRWAATCKARGHEVYLGAAGCVFCRRCGERLSAVTTERVQG